MSWLRSVQLARWANAAGRLPSVILQELASLAKQDMLRFELDTKPTLAFQVSTRILFIPLCPIAFETSSHQHRLMCCEDAQARRKSAFFGASHN